MLQKIFFHLLQVFPMILALLHDVRMSLIDSKVSYNHKVPSTCTLYAHPSPGGSHYK